MHQPEARKVTNKRKRALKFWFVQKRYSEKLENKG